jgi:hypothetical protein
MTRGSHWTSGVLAARVCANVVAEFLASLILNEHPGRRRKRQSLQPQLAYCGGQLAGAPRPASVW